MVANIMNLKNESINSNPNNPTTIKDNNFRGKIVKASDAAKLPDYIPTVHDKKRIIPNKDCFVLSGDGVFHTVQGEGFRMGYPITFVRLHFCNLACSWCDSYYTWRRESKEFWTEPTQIKISELHNEIIKKQKEKGIEHAIKRVCFTGGEPLIQQHKIIEFIKQNLDYYVEIETNGTILLNDYLIERNKQNMLFINSSPKLASSSNAFTLRHKEKVIEQFVAMNNTCFKFVSSTPQDIEDVLKEYKTIPHNQISIMPEGVTKEENAKVYENIMPTIIKYGLHTSVRGQNVMYDGAKRGV